ncbi:SSD domain-containing protein [Aphelenchoides bicaudatus]|nr:SSD domain-containing protein [Aphelenchoides bicaudatus]
MFLLLFEILNDPVTMRVVPFISLGFGVDSLFHVLHNYKRVLKIEKKHKIGMLLEQSGVQIVFATITIIVAFLAGKIIPVPVVCSLCSQIAILLLISMLVTLFAFPVFLTWDLRLQKANRHELNCCFTKVPETLEATLEESNKQLVNDIEAGPKINIHNEQRPGASKFKTCTLNGLLHRFYLPFLKNQNTQLNILSVSAILLLVFGGFAIFGLKTGLELTDIMPRHTPEAEVLRLRNKHFSTYPTYLITNGRSKFVVKIDEKPSELYWLKLMSHWLASIQLEFDKAVNEKLIDRISGHFVSNDNRVTDEMRLGRRLICSHGNEFNCTGRIGTLQLVNEDGLINPESFYNYLTAWFNMDNTVYYISQASFFPAPPKWKFWPEVDELIPPAPELLYTQIPFYLTGLTSTDANLKVVKEIRSICDNYTRNGLNVFPTGISFTFWDQYLLLNWNVKVAIFAIFVSSLVVMLLVACDFWVVVWMTYILILVIVEVGGVMVLTRMQLNPFSAVMFIVSIGIGMQYSVHVAFAFLDSVGTREQRMISCVERTFEPIVHSGVTTILALVVLFFSEFDLIFTYFFGITFVSVVIGLLNGLVLLPALLMLVELFLQIGRMCRKPYPNRSDGIGSSKKQKGNTDISNFIGKQLKQRTQL